MDVVGSGSEVDVVVPVGLVPLDVSLSVVPGDVVVVVSAPAVVPLGSREQPTAKATIPARVDSWTEVRVRRPTTAA
ncbi:hypothetical protein [Nannocystis pusilla]|uniref:hypothetical protein n=1 Tax=Nannocystis pusilla TaxID=889268 RepID=UPI003B77EDC6